MAHDKGSFDYKVINSKIKNILDVRSELDNTVQIAMPFIKATTTIQLPDYLGDGNQGFTLGLHAIDQDLKFEDMFSSTNGEMPLIGYTYDSKGNTHRVYAKDPTSDIIGGIFDKKSLYSSLILDERSKNSIRIPPPGITHATIGRNKNGLLASAQLTISVPSLIQLESLHRTLLIPGVGMILEWGQMFAQPKDVTAQEQPDISEYLFPWHNMEKRTDLLHRLALNQVGLQEILDKYVYPSNGQYMWMFGRVATFNTKANTDGSFECVIRIIGPSEDAWAYSTRNTVVPTKDPSAKYFCAGKTNSVYSYFTDTSAGTNFKSLLDAVKASQKLVEWKDHVQWFKKDNKKSGEPTTTDPAPNTSETTLHELEDSYFITWRFFVNIVLNDADEGIKSIFKGAHLEEGELEKIALLLPYSDPNIASAIKINDPNECYVGMNKYLRSTDLSTLVIVNETAANEAARDKQYESPAAGETLVETADSKRFKALGEFDKSTEFSDRGFLSTGVWINHKAIVESMIGADTILRGISNLLERMNTATKNYWQLTIDIADPDVDSGKAHNYMVVDANWRESSDRAVSKFIDNVHVFNKYVRTDNLGRLVGSELTECTIDLSLPKLLFTQIATLGLVQPEDLKRVDVEGTLSANEIAKLPKTSKLSSANDTLARMFAITTVSTKSDSEQGPDLTILPKKDRVRLLEESGTCGKVSTQTTAMTSGQGVGRGSIILSEAMKNKNLDELQKMITGSQEYLSKNNCDSCVPVSNPSSNLPPKSTELVVSDAIEFRQTYPLSAAAIDQAKIDDPLYKRATRDPFPRQLRENVMLYSKGIGNDTTVEYVHTVGSSHYSNRAIDIPTDRNNSADSVAIKNFWKSRGYFTIDEGNHIHVQWGDATSVVVPAKNPLLGSEFNDVAGTDCNACNQHRAQLQQAKISLAETTSTNISIETVHRQFSGLERIFRYLEVFPDYMVTNIADTADGTTSNAFGASPGALSITADLSMPGINGLRVGALFWIDRIPEFYKAFGAFQIITIEDVIGTDGWVTKIHSVFNYLGNNWKSAMVDKLGTVKK